jgi:hypothetical protein
MRQTGLLAGVVLLCSIAAEFGSSAFAEVQDESIDPVVALEVTPSSLTLEVGETAALSVTARDGAGNAVDAPVIFLSRARRSVGVSNRGEVVAYRPGEYAIVVMLPRQGSGDEEDRSLRFRVPVTVPFPPLDRIEVAGIPPTLYTGSLLRADIQVYDSTESLRRNEALTLTSSDAAVVSIDRFGNVEPRGVGTATIQIEAAGVATEIPVRVVDNPAVSLDLIPETQMARTGDVVRFQTAARDSLGNLIEDLPVFYSIQTQPQSQTPGTPASGQIAEDGRFVAELPGRYTVIANAGGLFAAATVEIEPRNVQKRMALVGRAPVRDRHTTDLWVWEAADGRDYAMTGTWRSEGHAYVWDVTDPASIAMVDRVQVDARTVNDVKVSRDGRIGVISREGASNRRNGIIILDMSDPRQVEQLSEFDEGLTGGVHNAFLYEDHVYVVNNGRRYDVVNIAEPTLPFRVSTFELETPGHAIHDVWVEDGIAYSSNWSDGVVLVDVGNGIAGGTPERPVRFASYRGPGAQTHAAFPFRSASTGRFYVVLGDEIFPSGMDPEGPTRPAGYMHIVDFTDFENPVEVARYEVPEAGSHNLWIEDDVMYAAFYNGGLRVVDLSGDLMGDLYKQGREIASFFSYDAEGYVGNEPMVWGAQPYKGLIYFSDFNSGLWVARLVEDAADGDPGELD